MTKFLLRLLISSVAVLLVASVLKGIHVDGFTNALIVAAILAVLNALLKPMLILLTIPVTVMTFGLFLLVINTIIILIADWMVPAIHIDGFWWAMLFSILLSIVNSVFFGMIRD
jgi:putative membrane protein